MPGTLCVFRPRLPVRPDPVGTPIYRASAGLIGTPSLSGPRISGFRYPVGDVLSGTARTPGAPAGLKSGLSPAPPRPSASCPFPTVYGTPLSAVYTPEISQPPRI